MKFLIGILTVFDKSVIEVLRNMKEKCENEKVNQQGGFRILRWKRPLRNFYFQLLSSFHQQLTSKIENCRVLLEQF